MNCWECVENKYSGNRAHIFSSEKNITKLYNIHYTGYMDPPPAWDMVLFSHWRGSCADNDKITPTHAKKRITDEV